MNAPSSTRSQRSQITAGAPARRLGIEVTTGFAIAFWLAACFVIPLETSGQPATDSYPQQQPPPTWPQAGAGGATPSPPAPPPAEILARGRQLLKDGQTAAALTSFNDFIRLRPRDMSGYFWQGLALDQSGLPGKAIWSYSNSLDLAMQNGMDSAELRLNIGNTLTKLNKLDDAIFNYRRAIEIDPKLARAHFNLGRALIAKGEAGAAYDELERSAQLNLQDSTLSYYRGLALQAMGKTAAAREQLTIFLKEVPETPDTEELRARVTALLNQMAAGASSAAGH